MTAIDVVITTFNRNAQLNRCLAALARQDAHGFRVFIVDDGSATPVEQTIPAEIAHSLPLQVIRPDRNRGPARGRNLGVAAGNAPLIAFIDDDVEADPGWLAALTAAMGSAPAPVAVIGPLLAPPDWQPTPWNWWEWHTLETEYRRMVRGVYEPTYRQFFTGNAMVRRADFEAAGGFDERFTRAEDVELAVRLAERGVRFVFEPNAKGWHYAERTLQSWLRIPREYARFDVAMDRVHAGSGWLDRVYREMGWRHPGMRAALAVIAALRAGGPTTASAVWLGRAIHRLGRRNAALPFLSLAYAIQYRDALERALTLPGQVPEPESPGPAAAASAGQRPAP